jgi:ABC-type glycerol-3-phosphate transport system permease component
MYRVMLYLLVALATFFTLGPFAWMVAGSFMTQEQIVRGGFASLLPSDPTLDNYRFLIRQVPFLTYLTNTTFVAAMTALLTTLISALGGFALAKYQFRGQRLVTVFMLATMLLPPVVLLAPLFRLVRELGLIDSYWALILPGSASGFGVLIMRQYLVSIPDAVLDAGRLDGASDLRIFWSLILPLVRPIVSALVIFTFLTSWNAYLWPMIVLRDEDHYLLTMGVTNVVASVYQQEYGVVLAGTLISIAPILVLFCFLQREFISGLTLGAVKQ